MEHLPDRLIYDFSQQPLLNSGNMPEGLKKHLELSPLNQWMLCINESHWMFLWTEDPKN
ncbi:hypothetical protein GNY06_07335 [Elizabethkingia argentiflava]|uniref:Uncharacterized protein n=1 Tax=Elizabethkingia argenteiflava TaxID=2681556 RepID=A0A845PWF3_9FLAO|nr:hypothetical protein [Elizabethkingia argenteiflava]NAW51196.1 hypothetical protein [Elizabethkingia argenteiflava]